MKSDHYVELATAVVWLVVLIVVLAQQFYAEYSIEFLFTVAIKFIEVVVLKQTLN